MCRFIFLARECFFFLFLKAIAFLFQDFVFLPFDHVVFGDLNFSRHGYSIFLLDWSFTYSMVKIVTRCSTLDCLYIKISTPYFLCLFADLCKFNYHGHRF